jgi:hypothetical protein
MPGGSSLIRVTELSYLSTYVYLAVSMKYILDMEQAYETLGRTLQSANRQARFSSAVCFTSEYTPQNFFLTFQYIFTRDNSSLIKV